MRRKISKILLIFKDFGFLFTIKYIFLHEKRDYTKYINFVKGYLEKSLEGLIKEYNTRIVDIYSDDKVEKIIWVCWWQGEDSMPYLVKLCYENLKKIVPCDYKLLLVTENNYKDYISLPNYILEKLEKKHLSITQFSDILRNGLLYENGGTWIDASIWCMPEFSNFLRNNQYFWSVKLNKVEDVSNYGQLISLCKWSGFLLSGKKKNIVNAFVYEAMCEYFKNHECCIDYFIHNMVIRIAYDNIVQIRNIIEDIEPSNPHIYTLYKHMNNDFCKEIWEEMCNDTSFFKLTQKIEYVSKNGGHKTFFGFLEERAGF